MIRIALQYNGSGLLVGLSADGHAGQGDRGGDVACAAVSVLIQTAARLLEGYDGVVVEGKTPKEGRMELKVVTIKTLEDRWLRGITDFITLGLNDIEKEYPKALRITVKTERRS